MKNIEDDKKCIMISKPKKTRKVIEKYKEKNIMNNIDLNDYKNDLDRINKLYMNNDFDHIQLYISYIRDKTNSYIYQDKKKNRNIKDNINYDGVLEKLIVSKLRCYYCKCKMCLLNEKTRQTNMWTLDRIDNSLPHTFDNTCVSCLQCNLQKRRRSHDGFKFTKQLKINKQNDDKNE